ncbi:uncharacterized protein UTRI_04533 [Ustilago trichophora]|uniref:Effector family protein Eff1 n=1 Tax=Ustilago trichophora TaxID=86804 RepID=A0A5C3EF37_9BASI|nr:uncharacterized protein UTRI_04533 [Ustilago trichophora]
MMLLRLIRSSVIAAALALLLTSLSFTAAMYPGEASSSAGPSAGPSRSEIVPSGPDVDTFIDRLNTGEIAALRPNIYTPSSLHLLPDVPYYGDSPVFTTTAHPQIVQRALRDHKQVIIVDPQEGKARQVSYFHDGGDFLQRTRVRSREEVKRLIFMSGLDTNLHVLIKHFQRVPWDERWPRRLPAQQPVEFLPHFNGIPIIESGTDNLGHMLRASKTGPQKFWLRQPGGDLLIDPHVQPQIHLNSYVEPRIRFSSESEKGQIERVVRGFDAAKRRYGESTASIMWGQPIRLSSRYQNERIKDQPLHKYKRFAIQDGQLSMQEQRDEFKRSLQSHGRYRLYDTIDPRNGPYKVKLKDLGAPPDTPVEVEVTRLSPAEKMLEKTAARIHGFSLPH